jgi:mono/diheme cytochrome c family protein
MKSLSAIIPTAALAALVIGCGGKTEQAATPAADSAAVPAAPAAAPAATDVPKGQYAVCQACHQENGQGLPPAFPPLAGSELVNGPAEFPIAIVLNGLQGPIKVKGVDYNGVMAPWGQFSDEDIAATLTYERASWGNTGTAVTAAEVAAVRAATKGRTTAWTWEELQKAKLK